VESGTKHLASAVAVCGQPNQLLEVLQNTLPADIFHLILQKLPGIGQVRYCIDNLKNKLQMICIKIMD
jgi:import receptor subunit TOM20